MFTVWAPLATTVEVVSAGERVALERHDGGWWRGGGALHLREADYAFALDGGEPLPDPRAAWLPHGVHGPARLMDHDAFRWTDAGWRPPDPARALVYELHVGTFSPAGTFDGVRERLRHLAELGVTHVELMPVNSFPGRHGWGYDGVGLFAPHEPYGGPSGLKRLVDACHGAGIGVLLDVVYNHLGPEGNTLGRFGPYFTDAYHTPWGPALNLDGPGSDEVRRFLLDSARSWLRDYHADGLRIDAAHWLVDRSALHFLEELAGETRALERELGRRLWLVAESDLNDPRLVRASERGGLGLDAQWNDDLHHALHAALSGERHSYYADFGRLADLAKACELVFVLDGVYSRHRARRHGRPVGDVERSRFVVYLQNHDQVGNRPQGDRIAEIVGHDLARVGAALLFLAPFPVLVFQGEEWAAGAPFPYFAEHGDPDLVEAVRGGRRRELAELGLTGEPLDPESPRTFERACLDWAELGRRPHAAMLEWYRALARLRKTHLAPDACDAPKVRVAFDEEQRWFLLARGDLVAVANLSGGNRSVHLDGSGALALLLASHPECAIHGREVQLPARAVAIARAP